MQVQEQEHQLSKAYADMHVCTDIDSQLKRSIAKAFEQ